MRAAEPPRQPDAWLGQWQQGLSGLRSIGWLGIVSAFVALALLLAFSQLMRIAVQTGESRQRAAAARFDATWRCQAERDRLLRQDCLMRLSAAMPHPPESPAPPARGVARQGTVAPSGR